MFGCFQDRLVVCHESGVRSYTIPLSEDTVGVLSANTAAGASGKFGRRFEFCIFAET